MTLFNFDSHKRAIAYYRHSAEDKQENSVAIQRDHAYKFAKENNIEIIHEEADEGKSGLSADRAGFQKLLNNWVLNDDAPSFDYILVYDVSRWGRFQNPDEAAMYQYQCTQRGKKLIFVEKGMPREGQDLSTHLLTAVERYMAADYSRHLSNKVFYGSAKISEQGYSAGGTACYGMSRLLLDVDKKPVRILKLGEHKQISNERVTFVPANDETTKTVKEIFNLCIAHSYGPQDIAADLNGRKIRSAKGGSWNREKVLRILTNETYTGTRIYNKRWGRLKQKSKPNPRDEWVICPNAFPAIIPTEVFKRVQEGLGYFMPSRIRPPAYAIHKLRYIIQDDLKNLLRNKNIGEDDINHLLRDFPLIFSTAYIRNETPHWCFTISERMRSFDSIIAIGLNPTGENSIADIFSIPIAAFNEGNFLIFSKHESNYMDFLIPKERIAEQMESMLDILMIMLSIQKLSTEDPSPADQKIATSKI